MNFKLSCFLVVITIATVHSASQSTENQLNAINGQSAKNNGKYVPTDEGRYNPRGDYKYVHVDDHRERGRYVHIPFPYKGGYGPYTHLNNPYIYDPTGEYSNPKYQTVSTPPNICTIETPEICIKNGFPKFLYIPPPPTATESYPDIENQNFDSQSLPENSESDHFGSCICTRGSSYNKLEKRESNVPAVQIVREEAKNEQEQVEFPNVNVPNQDPLQVPLEDNEVRAPAENEETNENESSSDDKENDHDSGKLNSDDEHPDSQILIQTTQEPDTDNPNSDNHTTDMPVQLDNQNSDQNNENQNSSKQNNLENQNLETQNSDTVHLDEHVRVRKSVFDYSQTRPKVSTTVRPRTSYDDEGKWRIISQNEIKKGKNYEYVYETENGILAQEQAIIDKMSNEKEGTNGRGFYQYPGDDGKIYRVEYTVGEQGFVPIADHLPIALRRSLEYHRAQQRRP